MQTLKKIYELVSQAVLKTTGATTLEGNTTDAVIARSMLVRCLTDAGMTKKQISLVSKMSEHTIKRHLVMWIERYHNSRIYRHFRVEVKEMVHEQVEELIQQSKQKQ